MTSYQEISMPQVGDLVGWQHPDTTPTRKPEYFILDTLESDEDFIRLKVFDFLLQETRVYSYPRNQKRFILYARPE